MKITLLEVIDLRKQIWFLFFAHHMQKVTIKDDQQKNESIDYANTVPV